MPGLHRLTIALLCAIGLLGTSFTYRSAHAQADPLQAANELFAIMSKDTMAKLSDQVTAQVWPSIEQTLTAKRPEIDVATRAELRSELTRLTQDFLRESMQDAPAIYARYFSAQELREMIAFYRTPTGEKALRVLPQVMSEFMTSLVPRLQNLQPQLIEAFGKVLRQRGYVN